MRTYQNAEFRQRVAMAVQDVLDVEDYGLVSEDDKPAFPTNLGRAIATCIKDYKVAEQNAALLEASWFDSWSVMLPRGSTKSERRTLREARNALFLLEKRADEIFYNLRRDIWRALPTNDRIRRIRTMTDTLLAMKVVGIEPNSDSAQWYATAVEALFTRATFDPETANEAGFKYSYFTTPFRSPSLAEVEPSQPLPRAGGWSSPQYVSA